VVVSAHLDAKQDTPGALDNAAGVVVLLLLGELLQEYDGNMGIELVPFNGEDHYSAAGEIAYLQANQGRLGQIALNINIDAAGFHEERDVYSLYECPPELSGTIDAVLKDQQGLSRGDPWHQGDHMVFAQQGVPAVAITSRGFMQIERLYAHTAQDHPDLVEPGKLVNLAQSLFALLKTLG
jgi:aminopeptidase YwaD